MAQPLLGQDLRDAVLGHPRFVAVPQARGRQPVLDRQPAGEGCVLGWLLPAAWAVLVHGLVGDGLPVQAQLDRAPTGWAVTGAVGADQVRRAPARWGSEELSRHRR